MFLRWVECQNCKCELGAPAFDMPMFVTTQLGYNVIKAGLSAGGEHFYVRVIGFVLALLMLPMFLVFLLVFGSFI